LVDTHIKSGCDAMEQLVAKTLGLDRQGFIHWYYILISASSTIFYFAPECKLLFGIESRDEAIIERHAELLVDMLVKRPAIFTEAGDTKA
jgi:TetR/AcrR family transcriptional regulator